MFFCRLYCNLFDKIFNAFQNREAPTTSEPIPEKTVSSEMNNLNDRTVEIVRKAADLLLRALDVESNAANTKVDALDVEAKLNELFMKSAGWYEMY